MWDIRLKDFFRELYVRKVGSDSCVMLNNDDGSGSTSPPSSTVSLFV